MSNPGGSAECHDVIGTVAIGSGEIHAVQSMIGFGHAATQPVKDTIFHVFASKRRAELAPGVGRDTDLMVLSPSGAVRLPDKALAKLGELYDSHAASVVASAQEQVSGWAFDLAGGSASTAASGASADHVLAVMTGMRHLKLPPRGRHHDLWQDSAGKDGALTRLPRTSGAP